MNQSRLGPRKWAFVVVTGGALLALPFMQRGTPPKPPVRVDNDILAALEPLVPIPAPHPSTSITAPSSDPQSSALQSSGPQTSGTQTSGPLTSDQQLATKAQSSYTVPLPAWAQAQQTPFDELMSQPAKVPSVPAPDVLPLQPLRPWITPPPKSESSSTIANRTQVTNEGSVALTAQTSTASPWSEENVTHDQFADDQPAKSEPTNSQSSDSRIAASSASQPAHGLSVDAWPDEHFSNGQVVSKLPPKRELQSAIVAPSDILPPKPGLESLAATPPAITRQPTMRSVTTPKIRFGQSNPTPAAPAAPGEMSFIPPANMQPLPALPESRRSHVIFQPTR